MTKLSTDIKSTLFQAIDKKQTFAAWRLPDESNIQFIEGQISSKRISDLSSTAFIISPFENNENTFLVIEENRDKSEIAKHFIKEDPVKHHSKSDYLNLVSKGIQAIKNGQFEKVVLSRMEEVELPTSFHAAELFLRLVESYPKAFVSIVNSIETGTWIGASPELLLKKEGKEIQSISLAGTISKSNSGNLEDISSKDRVEQEIVSQFIREKLDSFHIAFDESNPQIVNTGNLNHIKTSFIASETEISLEQLILGLHPTPAICGYPKDISKTFILKNEDYSRQLYGGILGPVYHQNKAELYVNLRCIQVTRNKGYLYAGAGILQDSIPENEWQETVKKMDTLRSLL